MSRELLECAALTPPAGMRLIPWSLAWLIGLSRLAPSCARAAPRAPPARADQIVITGTGRAGTTFLMALFTQLRLPTGFTPRDFANCTDVYACPHAGYEWGELTADALPALRAKGVEIVKSPHLAAPKEARRWLAGAGVAHVIVPLRDLANVSRSRVAHGHDNGGLPADVADGATLQHVNERVLAHLLVLIVQRDTPSTLLAFPRHVLDASYAFAKLGWLCERYRVSEAAFREAHRNVSEPELVHYRRRRRRTRRRRRRALR